MNPPNGQTPLDYLNQIAPEMPKKPGFGLNLRTVVFFGGIAVVLVIILVIIVSVVTNASKEPWQQLSVRLATTQTITDDATKKLKNSQIRSANSTLNLYLTNTQRDLAPILKSQNIIIKEIPASIKTSEAGTAMIARLEDGRLNGKFDSTYAREMNYQLSRLISLYQELYNTSSGSTKTYLNESYKNLVPIQKTIADFSASNE